MQVLCRKCDYRFDRFPDLGQAGPAAEDVCPRCGANVNVAEQIAELAARTTEADTPAQPNQHPPLDYTRRTFGEYDIIEEVSRGAMGVIYKAQHRRLRRIVALKVMIAGEHASPEQIARFEKEARAAARLRHPNIVPIYEIGIEGGNRYFTMDFIKGWPLDVAITKEQLSPRRVLEIVAGIADALGYAHTRGVIHRDVKPSNVMLDDSGQPQVMDFGLAKQVDSDTKFTRTGTTIGTPSYMSPEQAQGDNKAVDHRSDIYSLGAVMYEMLAGRAPFSGESMMNVVMKVIHDEPSPIRKVNPKLHRDIQTIVAKAMEKEPRRRYQTMSELAADIRRYLAGEMITARPAGRIRRAARTLKRYRTTIVVGLTIGLVAVAVSGTIIHVLLQRQAESDRLAKKAQIEFASDQKPEWVLRFHDDFAKTLSPLWKPSTPEWKVDSGRLAVITGGESYALLDREFSGNVVIEFTASTTTPNSRINCFMGESFRSAYLLRFGNVPERSLSLMRMGKVLAEADCPPIQPDVVYAFRIERNDTRISCRVSGGGKQVELNYDDPQVLLVFRPFRFGFDTWAGAVRFSDLKIQREEFSGERLNMVQSVDYSMLNQGQLESALDEYRSIIDKHSGKVIAVVAEHQWGLIIEALAQDPRWDLNEALKHYRNVQAQAGLLAAGHASVAAKNRERIFFTLLKTGQYRPAADELAAMRTAGGQIDAGTAWEFPALLTRSAASAAFEPALQIMEQVRFTGSHPTLRDQWQAASARFQSLYTKPLDEICSGFGEPQRFDEMKRAFLALPDKQATGPFERAVAKAVEKSDLAVALDLLKFSSVNGILTPKLEQSVTTLAQQAIDTKQYRRLVDVHKAYPVRGLVRHFGLAVSQLVAAGNLNDASDLFKEGFARFPQDKPALADPADQLMAAYVKAKRVSDLRAVYARVGEARFAGRLVEACRAQIADNDLNGALDLIEYIRVNAPDRLADVQALAADTATRLIAAERGGEAFDLIRKYPTPRMADSFIALVTATANADDRPLLERLLVHALTNFRSEARVAAAERGAVAALLEARSPEPVLRAYEEAANEKAAPAGAAPPVIAAAQAEAASIRVEGADLLLAAKAYPQAAALYASAGRTLAANTRPAAASMLRSAVIYQYLGDAESARRIGSEIIQKHPNADAEVKTARLMTDDLPLGDFQRWAATNAAAIPPDEANFHAALRLVADAQNRPARQLLEKIADKKAWYWDLAQGALGRLPRVEPVLDRPPGPPKTEL